MRFRIEKVNKRILQLAVPSIISNITVPLLVWLMSPSSGISAMRLTSEPLPWVDAIQCHLLAFQILRMGTSGMTSQALGRRDLAEGAEALVRSLSIGVG